MARRRKGSPRISLEITEENRQAAIESNSGGCLIADALKRAGWLNPTVDMATIRVTDPETKNRLTYLTPPAGQHILLSFDQGWPEEDSVHVSLRRAVKITPTTKSRPQAEQRAARLAELEAKERRGETLTTSEKAALTKMRSNPEVAVRPHKRGRAILTSDGTVTGGAPIPQGPAHPNLLRGRNRIYGAKLADPGRAFEQAVAAAVQERDRDG
jgi:hypothetical protein